MNKGHDESQLDNDPRLVALCLNCKKKKCHGLCDEYAIVRREISPHKRTRYTGKLWEMDGRKMTLTQWANEYGILERTLRKRVDRGMSLKEALVSFYERTKNHG